MKKTIKTIVKKYDKDGNLLEHTETIVEEEIIENKYIPSYPYPYPYNPLTVSYENDWWKHPTNAENTDSPSTKVIYKQ